MSMEISYICSYCGYNHTKDETKKRGFICLICNGSIKGNGAPGVNGTRDNFGVGKEFVDEKTGKTIDNWRSWEKAGYKTLDAVNNNDLKEGAKEKVSKCKHRNDKPLDHRNLTL